MRCSVCDFDNPQGMGFCGECGNVLAIPCPSCSGANPPGYSFCGSCGVLLEAPPSPPMEESAAERRQLTVMFCDLVGSTALSGRLDPEDLREVIRDYQAAATAVVERYEGHVAQHLGDGLLIYFGYPKAHEDDARRAVHAGLGVVEAVGGLSERLGRRGVELAVRVGIHTGPVVTGEIVGGETGTALALGQTPNVAAGLQELAEPNRVVLSAATHELVQGLFAGRPLGPRMPRGTTRAIEVFEVAGESGIRSQFELAVSQGLGPLIGRRRELVVLRDRFYLARDGRGQVVEITGEGGIGKSRQVHELRKAVAHMPHRWWTCRASPYARDDAFHPWLDHLADFFGLHHEDGPERKREKIAAGIEPLAAPPETVADLAGLLAVLPGAAATAPGRERIAELLLTILEQLSDEQPVVLFVEDLQWADAATVELVERLVDRIAGARILAVVTFRPAFRPPWPSSERVTRIILERLADEDQELMVEEVTGGKPLPPELLHQILEKAGGIPLFIEELTRMVLQSDWLEETEDGYEAIGSPAALGIPASLRDALMARLDHDPEAKEIAQLAAAFGREFSFTVLQAVSGLAAADLERRLDRLVEAELLTRSGAPPFAGYSFRHALIREAAYESVLKSARPRYHKDVAQALIQFAPEVAESQPELVAEHCTRARLPERAVGFWLEAGRRALARGRCREARAQLGKGLESAEALPPGEREAQELTFRCTLATTLGVTLGFDAPEVEETCARALELCRRRGEPPELFWVLGRLWAIDLTRPDLGAARMSGRRLLELAAAREDPEMLLQGHYAAGGADLFHGELTAAREHFEQALAFETNGAALAEGLIAADGGVASRSFLALALWHLGFPDRALAASVAAIGRARRIAHPFSVAVALAFGAWLHVYRREEELMREHAEELLGLAEKHELFLGTWARFFLALEATGGREHRSAPEVGESIFQTSAACLLAARHTAAGELGAAMSRIEAGLEAVRRTGESFWEAELHRHRGEIVLARAAAGVDPGGDPQAEACFEQALATARRQGARSLELRAAMSLSRLWRSQERRGEAQQLLAAVHGSFTEGHDSADLKEAEALLATLSS
ncbi:MAG: AAA family ATPase [bacterium]|nr:AAA family ATPase [bacterium]